MLQLYRVVFAKSFKTLALSISDFKAHVAVSLHGDLYKAKEIKEY